MKASYLLVIAMLVGGCATTDEPPSDQPVAIKYKYVVNTVPDEMFSKPEQVKNIDVLTATDKDAANWLVDSEKRYREIEKRLDTIKSYLEQKYKDLKVDPADIIKN